MLYIFPGDKSSCLSITKSKQLIFPFMTSHSAPRGNISAQEALDRLKEGNSLFAKHVEYRGDITEERVRDAAINGQHPYAALVSCSDSRVIPEVIFSAGIGELFVIRTAGNVVDDINTMGSLEYAVGHLGCNLIVVLGHTKCGAVAEALNGFHEDHALRIIKEISDGIGDEKDPTKASILNVQNSVRLISEDMGDRDGLKIIGALYDIETGEVEFFD